MTTDFTIRKLPGTRILEYPAEGPQLGNVPSVLTMIGAARGEEAEWIAVPMERLGEEFFHLSNGRAGEVLQKFVTYRVQVAILGDISPLSAASKSLHDFVVECNRGSTVWFVRDLGELRDRLCAKA